MEIRTFTTFWNMEKKLYAIYDLQLPFPIPIRSVIVFGVVGLPYWLILNLAGLSFGLNASVIFWILPPILLAFIADKPIFQGKNLIDFIKSTYTFLMESRRYKGLAPATEQYGVEDYYKKEFFTFDETPITDFSEEEPVKADKKNNKRKTKLWRKQTEAS